MASTPQLVWNVVKLPSNCPSCEKKLTITIIDKCAYCENHFCSACLTDDLCAECTENGVDACLSCSDALTTECCENCHEPLCQRCAVLVEDGNGHLCVECEKAEKLAEWGDKSDIESEDESEDEDDKK